jgi:hypothetical protein
MKKLTLIAIVLLLASSSAANASAKKAPAVLIKVPGKYDTIKHPPEYIPETWDMMIDRPEMWDRR